MKKAFIMVACATTIVLGSCKKDKDDKPQPVTTGTISIEVRNEVSGDPLELDEQKYTNIAGNTYGVSELKYYLSHFILEKADQTADTIDYFQLVDARRPEQCKFNLEHVPNGIYTKIKFQVGVREDRNHSGAQDGFLDPVYGMIWTWNTGYTFFKMEGNFLDNNSQNKAVRHHLGTDDALSEVEIPLNIEVQGNTSKIALHMDLNKVYANPVTINFNTDTDRQSLSIADALWISAMRSNLANTFSITSE